MNKFLNMLKKNETAYSIGKVLAVVSFSVWVVISIVSFILNRHWEGYETFTIATISFTLIQLCNKTFESRLFKVGGDIHGSKTPTC